jgi:hypothetical protein
MVLRLFRTCNKVVPIARAWTPTWKVSTWNGCSNEFEIHGGLYHWYDSPGDDHHLFFRYEKHSPLCFGKFCFARQNNVLKRIARAETEKGNSFSVNGKTYWYSWEECRVQNPQVRHLWLLRFKDGVPSKCIFCKTDYRPPYAVTREVSCSGECGCTYEKQEWIADAELPPCNN